MTNTKIFKAAFINLLEDYADNVESYGDSFCDVCPLYEAGNCSGDNGDYERSICAEEIFKHYVEEATS